MSTPTLFSPLKLGAIDINNRVLMAPLTRLRSLEPGDIPSPMAAEYYQQRASAGLIISEATQVSLQAKGCAGAPGLHSEAQIAAWRDITHQVHSAGGKIAVQLWHTGRMSHSSLQPEGLPSVAPSALPSGQRTSLRDEEGKVYRIDTSFPRALNVEEIAQVVADFRQAAINAREAGFDLLEIHGAHGYLIHQFLSPHANLRSDHYGGTLENRARLLFEIIEAMGEAWDFDRIGLRLSPIGEFQGVDNGVNDVEDTLWLLNELNRYSLAYLHISEPDWAGGEAFTPKLSEQLRQAYQGVLVSAGGYTKQTAEQALNNGWCDAIAFGRDYIANPDLVERFHHNAPLNHPHPETFYGGGAEGYLDYPFMDPAKN